MERFTFRSLRVAKKLDIGFLSRQFEISEKQIRSIEEDSSDISDETLKKYLSFFQVDYDQLYFGKAKSDQLETVNSLNKSLARKTTKQDLAKNNMSFKKFSQSVKQISRSTEGNPSVLSATQHNSYYRKIFYTLQGLSIEKFIFFINLQKLELAILLILNDLYFVLSAFFFKSKENNPRFALAYLFVKIRKWRGYPIIKFIYLLSMFLPTILGFLLFHELPNNVYGYLYSWPASLCGALVVLSLWKKIWINHFERNQKYFFESLERYFIPIFHLFLPALLLGAALISLIYPRSNEYHLTSTLIAIPVFFNNFLIGLFIVFYFIPIIDLKYHIKQSVTELFPFVSSVFAVFFLFFSSFADVLYRKYENLGVFYMNSATIFLFAGFIYLFLTYRVGLYQYVKAEKSPHRIRWFLLFFSLFPVTVFALTGKKAVIYSGQSFVFVAPILLVFIFSILLFDLKKQIRKSRE